MYHKPTHTDLYLNSNSNHHPSLKKEQICLPWCTLAYKISDRYSLPNELKNCVFAEWMYKRPDGS